MSNAQASPGMSTNATATEGESEIKTNSLKWSVKQVKEEFGSKLSDEEFFKELAELEKLPPEDVSLHHELPRIFRIGKMGKYKLIPNDPKFASMPPQVSDMPFDFPDLNPTAEDIKEEFVRRYLLPKPEFSKAIMKEMAKTIPRETDFLSCLDIGVSKMHTDYQFIRDPRTFEITEIRESITIEDVTPQDATSFQRPAGRKADFVRGTSSGIPFAPGGIETAVKAYDMLEQDLDDLLNLDEDRLRTIPTGFSRGIKLDAKGLKPEKNKGLVNIRAIFRGEDTEFDVNAIIPKIEPVKKPESTAVDVDEPPPPSTERKDIDDLLPDSTTATVRLPKPVATAAKREWAHVVDVNKPFPDFYEKVPDMAHKYPFELDLFQKRAVYHLERGDSVFVAAHTSAGKTVVAEYAIALAQKHMTRAIYTSPIKALSNQKFRDFRDTFDEVGILTGDVQIQPEASCLVMTTEILRSMLYRGADLIRDVEFVIFDEVHYVNDAERGVVWEEVIIMLPRHVTFILLSATVPNTREFADWVGRTKKKDIYVISTSKRPVPLEHFLYVEKELYKIVGPEKKLLTTG
ncbi:hypothetical protein HK101_010522 [Irineochytrium annulatum]|nr:hypothetical protein HK101_010522 [Irineochytrium annulatum]